MAQLIPHGGGLIAARLRHPNAPEPWLDLSTGINPVSYPHDAPPAAFARLPEPEEVAALEAVAARAYGVGDPAALVAAGGSQSLIQLLPRLLPGEATIVTPTYGEYAAAWAACGRSVTAVERLPDQGAVVVVCNPNNPDGRRFPDAELLRLATRLAGQGGMLVVDEAFAEFDRSLAGALPWPGLLLLRSFGKPYGLAGVRLGFALTAPALATVLRAALGPWAVSGPALHIGRIALADTAWQAATAVRLAEDAARMDGVLQAAGCAILGGTRLFRLVSHPGAAALADRLAAAGILVRRFADRPDWLRFGVADAAGCDRLERQLFLK